MECKYIQPDDSSLTMTIVDRALDELNFELHLPSYQFCGPGTAVRWRVAAGQRGINALDNHCMWHDLAYSRTRDPEERAKADKELI